MLGLLFYFEDAHFAFLQNICNDLRDITSQKTVIFSMLKSLHEKTKTHIQISKKNK
jgi:hypothetical protein